MLHAMAPSQLSIDSLPNEIIINVLSSFPTRELLPLAAVCRRFHGLVGRIQYSRLIEASNLQDHEMILECYHPSEKLSTPELFCEYLGTDGLTEAGDEAHLGELNKLYSRFRPFLGDERQIGAAGEELTTKLPTHQISLDSSELFSQMCTVTNLVKVGPRNGLFTSLSNVTDSVVRVWRDWLKRAAENTAAGTQQQANSDVDDPSILWTDSSKTVGLRFRVIEDESIPAPVLFGRDEDPSVSYTMEYQELLIKANWLLLSYETSEAQQVTHAGKAIVIASL